MNEKDRILESLIQNRAALKSLGVRRLALFGSVARGTSTPSSDLDFVVKLETETFDSYMELKEFLENLFARHVDLVIEEAIKPRLRQSILSEAIDAPGL